MPVITRRSKEELEQCSNDLLDKALLEFSEINACFALALSKEHFVKLIDEAQRHKKKKPLGDPSRLRAFAGAIVVVNDKIRMLTTFEAKIRIQRMLANQSSALVRNKEYFLVVADERGNRQTYDSVDQLSPEDKKFYMVRQNRGDQQSLEAMDQASTVKIPKHLMQVVEEHAPTHEKFVRKSSRLAAHNVKVSKVRTHDMGLSVELKTSSYYNNPMTVLEAESLYDKIIAAEFKVRGERLRKRMRGPGKLKIVADKDTGAPVPVHSNISLIQVEGQWVPELRHHF